MPIRWNKEEEEVDMVRNITENWNCTLTANFEDLPTNTEDLNLNRYFAPALKSISKLTKPFKDITIKKVMFSNPATIVFWSDGEKTVVKCNERDDFDPEKGLAMAIAKRALGNKGNYYNTFVKYIPELMDEDDDVLEPGDKDDEQ